MSSNQPPLAQFFAPWFSEGLCRDHGQYHCQPCGNLYGFAEPWNTNDFPHPAPYMARLNAQMARMSQSHNRPQFDVWVRWSGELRAHRITDPDSRLLDVLRVYGAQGVRVESAHRGVWGEVTGVPLDVTLRVLAECVNGNVLLVLMPRVW